MHVKKIQTKKLDKVKRNRNNNLVKQKLQALKNGAKQSNVNLMPLILEAVKTYASIGEICNVLREEFGEYRESIVL